MPSPKEMTTAGARRGGKTFLAATVLAQAIALLRYVALARLLGPEQLGLAATLVVTASFFDLISDTGSDRFLIQDRDGDTVPVQKLVQLVYVGRGLAIAAGLVIFAWPIAQFYKAPELVHALVILALSPLILGFLHLDVRRTQRTSDFRAEAVMIIAAETSSLVATVIAAWLTHSFTAILYGLITRAIVMVLVSHLRAERPYALAYARAHAPRLARFAAPLMLSGLLLFMGSQGDRVLVANRLGFAALGHYSAVLLLIYYPAAVILRYMHVIYMPMVAAGRDDDAQRDHASGRLGGQTQLLALGMAVGFAIVAPTAVTILYGARFTQSAMLVGMIGILQAARFLINWPSTVALAMGRTRTVLAGNLVRLLAFPGAFLGVALIGGLRGVVAGFIAGELISIAASLALLNRNMGRPLIRGFDRLAAFVLASVAIVGWNVAIEWRSQAGEIGLLLASLLLAAWIVRRERGAIGEAIALAARMLKPRAA